MFLSHLGIAFDQPKKPVIAKTIVTEAHKEQYLAEAKEFALSLCRELGDRNGENNYRN